MSKIVILDRDGVINSESVHFIKRPEEWTALPGSLDAISRLNNAGYEVVVATNQSGVGRGLLDLETLEAIHRKMHSSVAEAGGRIAGVFFCPHVPEHNCNCRKPKPGLLIDAAAKFATSLSGVPCIGDSLRDLQAAADVGARPILVLSGNGARTLEGGGLPQGTAIYDDLAAAVDFLVSDSSM
jgi:D-glycero-D-manno-heptose 1,7-bisphosphate phosphatase